MVPDTRICDGKIMCVSCQKFYALPEIATDAIYIQYRVYNQQN